MKATETAEFELDVDGLPGAAGRDQDDRERLALSVGTLSNSLAALGCKQRGDMRTWREPAVKAVRDNTIAIATVEQLLENGLQTVEEAPASRQG